jgi:glycosyltransferase involved in cell wall biosynthesis
LISAVLVTRNSASFLGYSLRSLISWVDEVVVVDMQSTDSTRDIAAEFGVRIVEHEPVPFVEPAREFAVAQCRHDWVLVLDPDELVPVELARTLRRVAEDDSADVVQIPIWNYMFGAPMNHTGWAADEDRHNRFFKANMLEFHHRIHSAPSLRDGARLQVLGPEYAIAHFSYLSVDHFIEKMNRYTTAEALSSGRPKYGFPHAVRDAGSEVWQRLIRKRGFRDDWRGYLATSLMVVYRFLVWAKFREAAEGWGNDAASAAYVKEAESLLSQYDG